MSQHTATLSPVLQASWAASTPLTSLDKSLANLLQSKQPSDDPRHLWLAALTSHQWGRGHACLDLATLQTQAAALLGWNDEHTSTLPADLHQAAETLPWTQGQASPLVLTEDAQGQRLYLRRAWTAEQTIRHHITQRLALPCDVPADLQPRLERYSPPSPLANPTCNAWPAKWRHKTASRSSQVGRALAKPPRWSNCCRFWWARLPANCKFTSPRPRAKRLLA